MARPIKPQAHITRSHTLFDTIYLLTPDHPRLQRAAIAYWDLLHGTVAACQPSGIPEPELLRRCAAAWGTVYGIARLGALGQIPRSVPGDIDSLLHEALDTLRLGWQASGSVGPHR